MRLMSRRVESNEFFWSFTLGSRIYGSRTSRPELGSGKAIRARVPVICGELGLMPHPTHPEGDMNVPKKTISRVALWGWKVHAMEACWEGRVMHFWKVFVVVTVVHRAETTVGGWENRSENRRRRGSMVVEQKK